MSGANAPRLVGAGPQKRVLFGLLDAAGWGWAGVRAVAWTLVIILLLGYIPDRAYYLVVSPTVDLGLNLAPIVNICPAENEGLPCPAPRGALLPWKTAATPAISADPIVGSGNEWKIEMSTTSHLAGDAAFDFENKGTINHEFLVVATDKSAAALVSSVDPATNRIDEATLNIVRDGPEAAAGEHSTFTVNLAPGHYVVMCNIEGHYKQGMFTDLQIESASTSLPAASRGGTLLQAGSRLYYLGGFADGAFDEFATVASVAAAQIGPAGLGPFNAAASLPAPRARAAGAFFAGKAYLVGGTSASEHAVKSVLVGVPDAATGAITTWSDVPELALPEGRTGAALVAVSDGLILIGGDSDANAPQKSVWKAKLDDAGNLGAWAPLAELPAARVDAAAVVVGDSIWIWGGRDETGPTGVALRGDIAVAKSISTGHSVATPSPDQLAQGDAEIGSIFRWRATEGDANLSTPRVDAALWSANGILYVAGGVSADGTPVNSMYWATPTVATGITTWSNVPQSDLPAGSGRIGAHGVVIGANALLVGGVDESGSTEPPILAAGTSPKAPVFRLGILGATIPGLAISGEVGQQLGYLSAAGAWTLNFVLLLAAAVVYAQRERAAAWLRRKLGRKGSATY